MFPTIVDISEKGQILIPVNVRKALRFKPKGKAYLIADPKKQTLIVQALNNDIIEELCGKFADTEKSVSWTEELEKERKTQLEQEEQTAVNRLKKKRRA